MNNMSNKDDKLIIELEELQQNFVSTSNKIIKDIKRQNKIMSRSDKRQKKEYDELQNKLEEVIKLEKNQKDLLDSFIKLIATAIDEKSKYTGGHCSRVPELSIALTKAVSDSEDGCFKDFKLENNDQLREIEIASWLHDCGKVVTPEYVVDKATKLETIYNRIHEIRTRFEVIRRDKKIEALERELKGEDKKDIDIWLEKEYEQLTKEFEFIAKTNIGGEFMKDSDIEHLEKISKRTWERNFDDTLGLAHEEKQRVLNENTIRPKFENLLDDKARHIINREYFDYSKYEELGFKTKVPKDLYNLGEVYNLKTKAGTLSYEERFKIQEHVMMTIRMLEELPFPDYLKNVPLYAGAHHETLIGTGYPRHLTKDEMPLPSRILAIADVFEALTAADRPYKEPKTLSASIKILSFMVKDKHIDEDLFKLFLKSGIYKDYADKYLKKEQIDEVDIEQYL
ncbi:MAG: HD domain-containing phosphohydrolase [Campylobacterota bacterium]|nr:HD domain-containing phosphohydrolase [Campylobacterota bacterium]